MANLKFEIPDLKSGRAFAQNCGHSDASYTASDSAQWKCRLGFCSVVPLEWKTAVRSAGGILVSSSSLNAPVGTAGICVQTFTVSGVRLRAAQILR